MLCLYLIAKLYNIKTKAGYIILRHRGLLLELLSDLSCALNLLKIYARSPDTET